MARMLRSSILSRKQKPGGEEGQEKEEEEEEEKVMARTKRETEFRPRRFSLLSRISHGGEMKTSP